MNVARLAVLVLLLGCDDGPLSPTTLPALAPSEAARGEGAEPAPLPAEGCAEALVGRTPAELRVALDSLGWSTVYADACAMEAARRAVDPGACDALSVRALREQCRDRIAIESGTPASCHADERGHTPLCLALAARHRGLCRSTPLAERALCEALLGDGLARCDRADVPDAPGCRARHAELAPLVGEPSTETLPQPRVHLRTTRVIDLAAHTSREEPVDEDLSDVERGAVLRWDGCTPVLTLGEPSVAPLSRHTQRFVEVRLPPRMFHDDLTADVALGTAARAWIARPSFGTAEGGGPLGGHGTVHVEPFEPTLGARVSLRLSAELARSPGHVEVLLEADVPLRDVIGAPARDVIGAPDCGGAAEAER